MAFKSIIGATCACLAVVSFSANAALVSRLGGLAYYDDVADLTWLADTNAAGTTMNWATANAWAAGLDIDGVAGADGWRLPTALNSDGSGPCFGYSCVGSEMGNMFYNVLGSVPGSHPSTTHNDNYNLFSNLIITHDFFWLATEQAPDSIEAWDFKMTLGFQRTGGKNFNLYAWAVHTGDVSAVPIPAAVWLFGSGLIGLVGVARRKKA